MHEDRYRAAESRLWASLGAAPTEQRLHLRRNDVTVRVQEIGDGPPVLFLHGANTSGASWAALASRLPGFRCLVLDRPGTGLSDPLPVAPTLERLPAFAETLAIDVLDALDLADAHLVATSFGGYIALRTAAAHPSRVRRMVQFSWPAGAPIDHLPAIMRIPTLPVIGRLMAAMPATERTVRTTFRGIGHGPSLEAGRITREDIDTYRSMLRDTDTMRHELALGRAVVSPWRGLDRLRLPDDLLRRITAPTYFIWGERDPFGGESTARSLVSLMPDADYEVMPGAGHAPWLDDLDHCASVTAGFLRREP